MPVCPACGQSNPARARFCMSCATPLPLEEPAPRGTRKTVTVVFCDVTGSTPLAERLDPESVREVMARFFREMRSVLEFHGGTVEKYIGDAVMAVFGIPLLHEDDALRAVLAAHAMRLALGPLNDELKRRWDIRLETRIGVNTGEVVVGDPAAGQALVVGDAVNVAARLEQTARPGEILIGDATYALVREHVVTTGPQALTLKGKRRAVTVHRLVKAEPGENAIGARSDPPFVGRETELVELESSLQRSIDSHACALVTVIGGAGVGKSRLSREFVERVGSSALVLRARCLPYGEGITFWPVAELVKQACRISDDEGRDTARAKIDATLAGADDAELIAQRVTAVISGASTTAGLQETFWAIRRFLAWLARDRPLVAIVDDLQWAEPTLLDLIEYLGGWSRDTALLILCLARPDLVDLRPAWGTGVPNARIVPLEPLADDESARLVEGLLGGAPIDDPALARITESAGGNPLFVEELLRMLEDDGFLRRADGRWVATPGLRDVPVPETIQAVLSARLDRLSPEERTVIRCAAVIGKIFWWGAVAELAPDDISQRVGSDLQTLVRKDLIRPERSAFAGEDAFRFHHILIQEAAYRGTPKAVRADLHERFAGWIERTAADRGAEFEEVIGFHLERAHAYRAELTPRQEDLQTLGIRAGRYLASAGNRALGRRDMPAAADLLRRATRTFPADAEELRSVSLALGEALVELGDLAGAEDAFVSAERLASEAGDLAGVANAGILRLFLLESTDPKRLAEDAVVTAGRLIQTLDDAGDHAGLARAWRLMGDLHAIRSHYAAADDALERAIEHARKAGDAREELDALGKHVGCGVYGPAPVSEVERRCHELLEAAGGSGGHEAPALRALAVVRAMQGRFEEAREHARRAYVTLEDLGLRLRASFVSGTAGAIELLAGDPVAAEREFRRGFESAAELGEQGFQATVAASLAHTLIDQRRIEEARHFAELSESSAAEDDVASQVLWRTAEARILALSGGAADGESLAQESLRLIEQTDDVNTHADTLMTVAEIATAAGNPADAMKVLERAGELYESKGNLPGAAAAARRRDALLGRA